MLKSIISAVCACLAVVSFSANAVIVNFAYEYNVLNVDDPDGYLSGKVAEGDVAYVEAYYDTDASSFISSLSDANSGWYSFPTGSGGTSVTVNGYTWITTGPITITVKQVAVRNTETGETWSSVQWLGDTRSAYGSDFVTTTIDSPINAPSDNKAISLLPKFTDGVIFDTSLPTYLDTLLIAKNSTGIAVQGGVREYNADGGLYSFNYGVKVVPIPAAVWLFGSGLLGLVGVARRKSNS